MNDPMVMVVVGALLWVAYFGAFGWYAAGRRGRAPIEGAVLGVLGGPMGVLLSAMLPADAPARAGATAPAPPPVPRRTRKLMGEVSE